LRLDLARFIEDLRILSQPLLQGDPLMRGTVYELKRKCGATNCVCLTEGKLHATTVISWSEAGKTRLKVLDASNVEDYRRMTMRYKDVRKIRRRIEKVFQEILRLVDRVEKKRRKKP